MKKYPDYFYQERHEATLYAAETILSLLLQMTPKIHSAIDIGCGVGTWLSVLKNKGVEEIQGIDGDWVNRKNLVIPEECFKSCNLSNSIPVEKRFDLAISLEVAEHLPYSQAKKFTQTLTELSDIILFSAAIPFQGGKHHLNEQWPDFWAQLFNDCGYEVIDCIRNTIWTDEKIPYWYRQNTLLYVKRERMHDMDVKKFTSVPLSIVHPELYIKRLNSRKKSPLKTAVKKILGT